MVRIPALKMSGEKNVLLICVHYAHVRECATALHVITFFASCFGTDLFMAVERSKDITHVKLL